MVSRDLLSFDGQFGCIILMSTKYLSDKDHIPLPDTSSLAFGSLFECARVKSPGSTGMRFGSV